MVYGVGAVLVGHLHLRRRAQGKKYIISASYKNHKKTQIQHFKHTKTRVIPTKYITAHHNTSQVNI